jgi:Zn finger protein HypA/HybF involved in hydrogenase expression
MEKKKTSIIWKVSDEEFVNLIKNSKTMSEVLRYFGLENKGNNYHTCKKRISFLKLDSSHFMGKSAASRHSLQMTEYRYKLNLTVNSMISRNSLKKYLINFKLLNYNCDECKNGNTWNNKILSLQLDHKNGISNDNRIENLRFLCPNCHSQTPTFAGKRLKIKYNCKECNVEVSTWSKQGSGLCASCSGLRKRKTSRPSKDILEREILEFPLETLGKKYGVSGNAIKKWCGFYQLKLPNFGRGYWTSRKSYEKVS